MIDTIETALVASQLESTRQIMNSDAKRDILLVVENDPEDSLLLSLTQDHSVSVARTGTIALATIRRRKFDLILMDLQLSDVSGSQVLTVLRESYSQVELPVILI